MLKISIPSDYRYDATRNTLRGLHGKSKRRIHRLVVFPLNFRDGNTPRESQNSKIRVTSAIDSSFKVLRGTHRVPSIAIATGTRAKCSFEFNFRRTMFRFFFFVFFFFFSNFAHSIRNSRFRTIDDRIFDCVIAARFQFEIREKHFERVNLISVVLSLQRNGEPVITLCVIEERGFFEGETFALFISVNEKPLSRRGCGEWALSRWVCMQECCDSRMFIVASVRRDCSDQ